MSAGETIFHKIIRREIPADIVFENEELLAFRDINPQGPQHLLVIPKKTIPSLQQATNDDALLLGRMLVAVKDIAAELGLSEAGYRVVINVGKNAGMEVPQLHMHLIGGRRFSWPPG